MDDLAHLFSAYFYEAWDEHEYATWQEAVGDFARRSPDRVPGPVGALRKLLSEPLADDRLDRRLRELGCTFKPGQGDRHWLQQLLDEFGSSAERH